MPDLTLALALFLAIAPVSAGAAESPYRFTRDNDSRRAAPELRSALSESPLRVEWTSAAGPGALAFVSGAFDQLARDWKLPSDRKATRTLRFEIETLDVEETPESVGATYRSTLTLRLTLFEGEGRVLWKGKSRGSSSRFGRAGHRTIANLVASDAFTEALASLLGQESLQEAWLSRKANTGTDPKIAPPADVPKEAESNPAPARADEDLDSISPDALLDDLLALMKAGFDEANLLDVVASKSLTRRFTDKDIASWRGAGVSEAVLRAAQGRPTR